MEAIGFVDFSPKFMNEVSSNVIGAAAYFGRDEILEFCLSQVDGS